MKTMNPGILIMLLALSVSCSDTIRIKSDYDRNTNFSQYTTYDWLAIEDIERKNNPLIYNELTDKRIKKAVDGILPAKGIARTQEHPKLRIHYHLVVENRTAIRPDLYGSYSSPYWNRAQVSSYTFREGTLILDLMDADNNALVWRGWSINILEGNDLELSEERINQAIIRILEIFPPVKK